MQESYYELRVKPSSYRELFCELIMDITSEAIEEIGCEIVVRSFQNLDSLCWGVEEFAKELSLVDGKRVDVELNIEKKLTKDWIKIYRDSIKPINIGGFYIRASWDESFKIAHSKESLEEIVVDPGLAFGSGHHESTKSCVEILSSLEMSKKSFLDIGCGSGILSLCAAKRGAIVDMCDTDSLAISESKKNFELNLLKYNSLLEGTVNIFDKKYDIVVANIVADVLNLISSRILNRLTNGSYLLLSGIVTDKQDSILKSYSDLSLLKKIEEGDWTTLLFQKL